MRCYLLAGMDGTHNHSFYGNGRARVTLSEVVRTSRLQRPFVPGVGRTA